MVEFRSVISRFRPATPPLAAAIAVWGMLVLGADVAWARKSGIAASGCNGCHSGGKEPTVTLTASPMNPTVGATLTLTVTVSQTNGPVAGFYLTTNYADSKGTFRAVESGTLANAAGVTHTTPRTGSGGVTTFKVEWTAPATPAGVNFSVFALSGSGDGSPRGDAGGMASLSLAVGCTGATYYIDQDGDGYGSSQAGFPTRKDCAKPAGYAEISGDCDDFSEANHPGATELCDGKDNNCDGRIDEAIVNQPYCEDKDGDGHGTTGGATKSDCKPSAGYGDCKGDCNDNNAAVYPGAPEICDGRDNNCNGNIDEGVRMTCGTGWCRRYADGCSASCTPGPPIVETCNYFDDDCDGVIDNGTDAALCGGPGLACVLGKCIPEDGVSGTGGTGGGDKSGTGGTGGAGASGVASGGGITGTGAGAASSGGAGGCATIPGAVEWPALAIFLSVGLLTLAASTPARRRRPRSEPTRR